MKQVKSYRIKESVRANGTSFFTIQERFLFFFWTVPDHVIITFCSKQEAEDKINYLEGLEIVSNIIHK